jgi:hypothetical protein
MRKHDALTHQGNKQKKVDGNKQLSPSFFAWSGLLNHVSELLEAILFKLL